VLFSALALTQKQQISYNLQISSCDKIRAYSFGNQSLCVLYDNGVDCFEGETFCLGFVWASFGRERHQEPVLALRIFLAYAG